MTREIQHHINPIQWQQAVGLARQTSASVFRDGGTPLDALTAFGLTAGEENVSWEKAIDHIAAELCAHPVARAA